MTRQIHVLYVDDELDLLNIRKRFFEQIGDYTVTTSIGAPWRLLSRIQQKLGEY